MLVYRSLGLLTCVDENTGVWMKPVGKDLVESFQSLDCCEGHGRVRRQGRG